MFVCPRCPSPLAGAPFIKLDYRVACWATKNLSAAGLRAWLRLVTYFRNDRPIPEISERRLAQITGLSVGAAHKVFMELRQVLVFAGDDPQEPIEATAGELQSGCSQPEQGAHDVSMRCSQHEQSAHDVSMGCSQREQKRSRNEQKRSQREHDTISIQEKEQEQEINPPPPTSSVTPAGPQAANPNEEEERSGGTNVPQGETASSPPAAALLHPWAAEPHQCQPRQPDPRLQPVAEELRAYWAGKSGSRTALAFAAQQAQLLQILDSPIGGIEEVRGQIATAAMKDWDLIRYQTWHDWRQKHPPPLLLQESDLNDGALFPGLKSFERRYRATYGQNSSSADVLAAFNNVKARLERERSLQDLDLA